MSVVSAQNVLIFDSGVGGLSVYQDIQTMLPNLNYFYLFDNAAYPYGELEQSVLIERVVALVSNMVTEHHIDLVVIACNTASTIVLPHLRQILSIPVVGVVPAIKPASLLSTQAVALIATPATITRQYTHDLIRDFAQNTQVKLLGSTRLVDMAEEKLRGWPVDLHELATILAPIVEGTDVAVLGCTHFPLLKEEITLQLGTGIQLVDSGQAIARRVRELLPPKDEMVAAETRRIFSTAPPWGRDALNQRVIAMGFSKIEDYPHLQPHA